MVSFYHASMHIYWKHFAVLVENQEELWQRFLEGSKPNEILGTMKHCLQLWHNCFLIYFQSWFCIYLSCKQLPKVRLPLQRNTLISFQLLRHISLLCFCSILSSSASFSFSYEGHLSLSAMSQNLFYSTGIF